MTSQVKEKLILDGNQTSMLSLPRIPKEYVKIQQLENRKPSKEKGPTIFYRLAEFFLKRLFISLAFNENQNFITRKFCSFYIHLLASLARPVEPPTSPVFSTACWRNYIGTWEIKNNKFYLVSLEGRYKLINNDPIFAEWFDGELIVPQGKILHHAPFTDFDTVYESERLIRIKNGKVIGSRVIDNSEKVFDNDENPANW